MPHVTASCGLRTEQTYCELRPEGPLLLKRGDVWTKSLLINLISQNGRLMSRGWLKDVGGAQEFQMHREESFVHL